MSTVRSIERRLYVRRQADRDLASQMVATGGELPRHMEWNGVWTGYLTFVGIAVLLLSFVLAVGFSSLNPLRGSSWAGVGTGTLVWSAIVILISLWVGCWIAARTPRSTKQHGMMKGVVVWAMALLSVLLVTGWVAGTAVTAATSVAGSAAGAAATDYTRALQGVLQTNGINITQAQATDIAADVTAGNRDRAADTLSTDAGITPARANTILGQVPAPAGLATTAGQAVKHTGGSLSWGLFWVSLIGLGCALTAGAAGGGGLNIRRQHKAPQPAA